MDELTWAPDRGPWRAVREGISVFLESADFTHDVRLYVNGDFASNSDKLEYAKNLAEQLNGEPQ